MGIKAKGNHSNRESNHIGESKVRVGFGSLLFNQVFIASKGSCVSTLTPELGSEFQNSVEFRKLEVSSD